MDTDQASLTAEAVELEPSGGRRDEPVGRSWHNGGRNNQQKDWLDARVLLATEKSLIGIMKNLDNDNNVTFVWGSLRGASYSMLTFMLNNDDARDAFETAVIQVSTSGLMVLKIFKSRLERKEDHGTYCEVSGQTSNEESQPGCAAVSHFVSFVTASLPWRFYIVRYWVKIPAR